MKTCASDKVSGMRDYGMQTLTAVSDLGTKQVTRVLEAPVCRQSVGQLGVILDVADHVVDTFLPENGNDFFQVTYEPQDVNKVRSASKLFLTRSREWHKTEYRFSADI